MGHTVGDQNSVGTLAASPVVVVALAAESVGVVAEIAPEDFLHRPYQEGWILKAMNILLLRRQVVMVGVAAR